MAEKIIAKPVAEQLKFVFSEIEQNADAVAELIVLCIGDNDLDDLETKDKLLVAARALSRQICWAANLGGQKLGSILATNGKAEDWMMPPAYHDAVKAVEVSHV